MLPVPTFETIFLEHNSLVHWRPHVLIFLECWIFFPQQIYFANGFWPRLASEQEHSLYCGGQNARITATVRGGKLGAAPRTPRGHPEKRRGHIHLPGPLFSSSCFLSTRILDPRILTGPHQLPRAGHCIACGPVVPCLDLQNCLLSPGLSVPHDCQPALWLLPGNRPGNGFRDNGRANPQSPVSDAWLAPAAQARRLSPSFRKALHLPLCETKGSPRRPQGDPSPAQLERLRRDPLPKCGRVAGVHPNEALHPALPLRRAGHHGVRAGPDSRVRTLGAWAGQGCWGSSPGTHPAPLLAHRDLVQMGITLPGHQKRILYSIQGFKD